MREQIAIKEAKEYKTIVEEVAEKAQRECMQVNMRELAASGKYKGPPKYLR